jgi:hypothetical protein
MHDMGRVAVRVLVGAALIAVPLLVTAAADAARRSGVTGRVAMDGPCVLPGPRCDDQSVPATIEVRRTQSGRLVRTVHTSTGRFHIRLRPGRYRLRATADSGNGAGSARVRVRRHHFTVVVVHLHSPAP